MKISNPIIDCFDVNCALGRGEPVSILDLAKMWVDDSRISFVPLRKNEGLHTESDWKSTYEKLGWLATKSIRDYITSLKF
jgi:hypothetical protein